MPFLQKKPQVSEALPYYTLGLNKTLLIVGLGNPGKKYEQTRHNIGFACIDAFAVTNGFPLWTDKKDLKCLVTSHNVAEARVILAKPTTYMNLSGQAVQALANFYRIPPESILVVYDELAIPFGQIRTRVGGSAAGHNGVKSLIEHLGEIFGRVRIGIGPKTPEEIDSADFVLAKFSKEEQAQLPALVKEATAITSEYVYGDQVLPHETRNFLV